MFASKTWKTCIVMVMAVQLICTKAEVSNRDKEDILHSSSYAKAYQKYMSTFYPKNDDTIGTQKQSLFMQQKEKRRQRKFVSSVKMTNKHNKIYIEGLSTYKMTVNYFSIMEYKERLKHTGLVVPNDTVTEDVNVQSQRPGPRIVGDSVPEQFCWKEKGYVTDPKNQGSCGSCWAYASVVNVEYIYKKVTGKLVQLSEQEVLDCTGGIYGCIGGWLYGAFKTLGERNHIATMADYPYKSREAVCEYERYENAVQGVLEFGTVGKVEPLSVESMIYAVVNHGPIFVAIHAAGDFFNYDSGIYLGCANKNVKVNHAIALVGYGKDYFTLKNSWGAQWGEKGYIRVVKGNTCLLLMFGGSYMTYTVNDGYKRPKSDPSGHDNSDKTQTDDDKTDEDKTQTDDDGSCKDKKETRNWHCGYYSSRGACTNNPRSRKFMAAYCPHTCGFCS